MKQARPVGSALHVRRERLAYFLRHAYGAELPLLHRHEDVLAGGDDAGLPLTVNFEVEVNGRFSELAEEGVDDQQLIERYRVLEVAFDVHARQPDADLVE